MGSNDQYEPSLMRYTCVLCGDDYSGWGNNPEPLASYDDGRCCDTCNTIKVIPARIGRMHGQQL